jgi:dinuclear metal center YbgI/SA1388 family protein
MKLKDIIRILEGIAPPEYAKTGDKIGLQIGDPSADISRVIVTVDVTRTVVSEAIRRSAELIVAHHPLIYEPIPAVRLDVYPQSLVYLLVNAGINLYVMHTNFDAAPNGINDVLADRLGVVETEVLEPTYVGKLFKVVTFVPAEAVDAVRDALAEAGAGVIGKYTHCSFQSPGTGTFKPLIGAHPYTGKVGELSKEPEFRLEMLVDERHLHEAITAMISAHPYEEVAYDIYPLRNQGEAFGLGRYGRLRNPMTLDGFCEMIKDMLEVEDLRVCGDLEADIEKVALMGGGGGSRIALAHSKGVDVYVTGDVNHHQFQEARAIGLNVIDATHFHTERPGMIALAPRLYEILSDEGITVEYVDDLTQLTQQ